MKSLFFAFFVCVVFCLNFTGCGSESSSEEKAEKSSNKSQATRGDFIDSELALSSFLTQNGLGNDPVVLEINQKVFDATRAFTQMRKNHPELKSFYEKSDEFQSEMIKSKMANDDAAFKAATDKYRTARWELEAKAAQLEDIKLEQEKLMKFQAEQNERLAQKVESVNDEGKKLAQRFRELREQFN